MKTANWYSPSRWLIKHQNGYLGLFRLRPLSYDLGMPEIVKLLTDGYKEDGKRYSTAMTLAWPVWFSEAIFKDASLSKNVRVDPSFTAPLMGTWVLAIPNKSQRKVEAMRAISQLTTNSMFQLFMARTGAAPVIRNDYKIRNELMSNTYWMRNYGTLRETVQRAKPRPRSPSWHDIEQELGL